MREQNLYWRRDPDRNAVTLDLNHTCATMLDRVHRFAKRGGDTHHLLRPHRQP
jgi:hypothetical protein